MIVTKLQDISDYAEVSTHETLFHHYIMPVSETKYLLKTKIMFVFFSWSIDPQVRLLIC